MSLLGKCCRKACSLTELHESSASSNLSSLRCKIFDKQNCFGLTQQRRGIRWENSKKTVQQLHLSARCREELCKHTRQDKLRGVQTWHPNSCSQEFKVGRFRAVTEQTSCKKFRPKREKNHVNDSIPNFLWVVYFIGSQPCVSLMLPGLIKVFFCLM